VTNRQTLELASAVARYHAGCLRVIGAQNVAQTDVRTARKAAFPCDIGQLIDRDELLHHRKMAIPAPVAPDPSNKAEHEHYREQLVVWDRLRELALKAAVEAHQREVIYAGPLLHGALFKKNTSSCEPVLAPLFLQTVTVASQSDGSVSISATDEPPRFNTSVWSNAFSKTDADQIVTLGINAQAELSDGWDDERVEELLRGLHGVFPGLKVRALEDRLEPWPQRVTPAQATKLQPHLQLHSGAALYLANKSSPYLLADLDRMAAHPDGFVRDDRPLSVLLRPPDEEIRPELEQLDIHEVVFPFPSNGPQRRVVDAVEKNRIVVVQGPPGNGKSLTIANLAAHLVSEGKSVLVCSHKEQALTVVRDKLDEIELRFLYASMVGTSANTKRELQGQIQDVKGFFAKVNQHTLRKQLAAVEERRRMNGEHYQELRDDFNNRAEGEQAEAERLLLSIESIDLLPADDPEVPVPDRDRVAQDLSRLGQLAREHRQVWAGLCASPIAAETSTGGRQQALMSFLSLQLARLDAATDPFVQDLVRQWQPIADERPSEVDIAVATVEEIRDILRAPVAAIRDDPEPERVRAFVHELAADTDLRDQASQAVEEIAGAFDNARQLQHDRNAVKADIARRHQVAQQHALLKSFLKKKAARKWLDEHAPGAAGLNADQLGRWARFWDAWERLRGEGGALGGELKLALQTEYDPTQVTGYLSRVRRALAVANAIESARAAAREKTRLRLPLEALTTELSEDLVEEHTQRWQAALAALGADRSGNEQIRANEALAFLVERLQELDSAVDEGRYDDARPLLQALTDELAAMPALAERAQVLEGPAGSLTRTLAAIEHAAVDGRPGPGFLEDLAAALAAQPTVHRLQAIAAEDTTRALAEALKSLREKILADARQVLSLRIQQRIYEGFLRPKFTASLERFRKAIGTSAKRFDRLEELKNSPQFDVDVLTEVFPCWIMRPEDACRMFPLRHDIFDVVIFDEASQCNPDQTLPIFARAKCTVVFGDDNQLSNEDLKRSLAGNANKALLTQSKLVDLDPAGLFDQTENSLLGLASTRDQAPIVLSEHFRCRPELVAFSNTRFYADGLRVMRDAEDDRGLGPAILIHELEEVPPIGKGKVNAYEAEYLVDELVRILDDERYLGLSIGVLSLFREQIEHIEGLVERRVAQPVREQRRLICSTVDGFQGDERDVILYSWRYSTTQSPSILAFTNGRTGDQRVNVALTRARHQAIHFVSAPVERFPPSGNSGQFLRHALEPDRLVRVIEQRAHREPLTVARRRAAQALIAANLRAVEQFVACGVGVDLVVHDPESWARAAIFIDGEIDTAPPPTADRRVDAQGLLERAGWTVERILADEALGDPARLISRVRDALARCGPREKPAVDAKRHHTWRAGSDPGRGPAPTQIAAVGSVGIAPEDLQTYHWSAPSVESRLASGEDVFQSDFERDLYDRLAQNENLRVVPQWPSRGKFIDLVLTDQAGRRLAVEADGEQHHQTVDGELIPEDIYRQQLLEEVGWIFHRVRFTEFCRDPDTQIDAVLRHLASLTPNEQLAADVWGVDAPSLLELEAVVEPGEAMQSSHQTADAHQTVATTVPAAEAIEVSARSVLLDDERPEATLNPTPAPAEDESIGHLRLPIEPAPDDGPGGAGPAARIRTSSLKSLDPEGYAGADLDEVPLGLVPHQIALLVLERRGVSDSALAEAYTERFGVTVPRNRHRLLGSFAWSAAGRRFITKADDLWVPGEESHPIEQVGTWTMEEIEGLVRELVAGGADKDELFELVIEVIWDSDSRVARPVAKAIGSAIYRVVGRR
jgi:very-short-patch-repair endonuclease